MGFDSSRDAAAGSRYGRRRFRAGGESRDWDNRSEEAEYSHHHPHDYQDQRHLDLAPSPPPPPRSRKGTSSKALDASASAHSAMPPWPSQLARVASDAYRRPKGALLDHDEDDESIGEPPRTRRNSSSPGFRRHLMPGAFSEPSSSHRSPSVSSFGRDDDFEVEEVMGDSSDKLSGRRLSSRDDYMNSSPDQKNRYRRGFSRRYHSEEDPDSSARGSVSDMGSRPYTRESSRTRERSESPRRSSRNQLTLGHAREDSRPRLNTKRSSRKIYRPGEPKPLEAPPKPAEITYPDPAPQLRRSNTNKSTRSLGAASTSGPARVLDTVFGTKPSAVITSRKSSPDRRLVKTERFTRSEKAPKGVECIICREDVSLSQGADLKCGHRMCNPCLKRIFEISIHDPQHMPPRCCTQHHIPLKHVDNLFDVNFKKTWNRKFAEFSTHDRIYCPSRRCGEWIKPVNIRRAEDGRKVARCTRCKTKVCVKCNGKWHASLECPKDEETARFLEQAKEEGWKRCYRCKAMVELKEGCNHMTCRCGAQFCMICGVKWKGCSCPWFNFENNENPFQPQENALREPNAAPEDTRKMFRNKEHISMEDLRAPSRRPSAHLSIRPRAQTFEDERLRRLQEQRDANLARRLQRSEDRDDAYDKRKSSREDLGKDRDRDWDRDHDRERDRERERDRDRDRDRDHDRDRDRHRGERERNRDKNRDRDRDRDRDRNRDDRNRDHDYDRDYDRDHDRDYDRDHDRDQDRDRDRDWDRDRAGGPSNKHHAGDDYRRTSLPTFGAPLSSPPEVLTAQDPSAPQYGGYGTNAHRSKGSRGRSMERRLAERLSDNRTGRQSRGASPTAPPPAMRPHVTHPRTPPAGLAGDVGMMGAHAPPMGVAGLPQMPPPQYAPMPGQGHAPGPAPPVTPMMRPNPFASAYYSDPYNTPRSVHEPYYHGNEKAEEPYSARRRARARDERPKSSILAGLTGYGRGMHRVSEWRNFVEPGVPDEPALP